MLRFLWSFEVFSKNETAENNIKSATVHVEEGGESTDRFCEILLKRR